MELTPAEWHVRQLEPAGLSHHVGQECHGRSPHTPAAGRRAHTTTPIPTHTHHPPTHTPTHTHPPTQTHTHMLLLEKDLTLPPHSDEPFLTPRNSDSLSLALCVSPSLPPPLPLSLSLSLSLS